MNYNKEEVMQAFDEQFGKAGPNKNCDSIGREAGCDDCSTSIKVREETRAFLSTALDAAFKAGEEARTEKVRDVMKKAYQNHKEDHLCRFNDGEQNCNCYLSGINEVIVALEELK